MISCFQAFLSTATCAPPPRLERLHPFERALLELTLRDGHYAATLHQVDLLRKGMLGIGKGLTARAAKSRGPREAVTIREEGFKEMESYYKRGQHAVDDLKVGSCRLTPGFSQLTSRFLSETFSS